MRIRLVSRVLAILGFCAVAGAADAQSGSIAGTVTRSEGGGPVGDVTVRVLGGGGAPVGEARTGADGAFRITNVAAGTYRLSAQAVGFVPVNIEGVRVTAGATTTQNITMQSRVDVLTPVAVTGVRGVGAEKVLDSPSPISVVPSDRIADRPSVTVTDHIKGVPGVSVSHGGIAQSNIVSRGFNNAFSTTMMMLQDYRFAGVPSLRVNVPFLFTGTGEDIERIEVLQGPASALYGPNSGSGVLHVITKSPFDPASQGTTFTLDGGERSLMRFGVRNAGAFGGGKFGYKVSGEYFTAKDWEYNDPNETAASTTYSAVDPRLPASRQGAAIVRNFDLERMSGEARLDWRPNEDTEAITTFGYSQIGSAIEITTTFGAAQVKNWSYTSIQQRFRHKNTFAQVFFNGSDAGNSSATDDAGTYYLRSGIPVVDQSSVLVAQLQQALDLGETRLTGGFDYIATRPKTAGTIMGRNEDDDAIDEMGAYVQVTHPLSERVDFTGAVRGDMNSRIEGSQFSPRAALIFKAAPTHNFRFTYNRAFNSPASFSYFLDQWSGLNQNLGPLANRAGNAPVPVQIFGNPAKEGWDYDRSCGALNGGLCMRTSGAVIPASSALTLNGLMNGGLALQFCNNWAAAFALTTTQRDNICNAMLALNPTNTQVGTVLRDLNNPARPTIPLSAAVDLAPLGANFSNTWEIGYKGIFGEKFRLAVDYWYQIRPAEPTTQLIPQAVFYDPATLSAFLQGALGGVMATNGIPAGQIPNLLGNPTTGLIPTVAGIPTGTLNMDNPLYDNAYLIFTYKNAVGQVDVRGIDVGMDYVLSDRFTVEASYSFLSRNVFPTAPGATAANPLAANAPKHRASGALRFVNAIGSISAEGRVRYYDAMEVNSGVFNSYNINTAVPYESVPVNMFVDANFSWRLPFSQNVRWAVNAQNLLGNEVQSFVGVPAVGRLVTTRLQYSF